MNAEQKFNAIRARAEVAEQRLELFKHEMIRKYGQPTPPCAWVTRTEEAKRAAIYKAQGKAWDEMFKLLEVISPRSWSTGVAAWWVMRELTYADAITYGALAVVPKPGYGTTPREVERFAEALAA